MGLFDKFRFGTLLRTSVTGKPDQDIHKYYEMGSEPIGSGRFGVVYNGTHRETGEKVAIKTI